MAGQIGFYHHEGRPMAGQIGFCRHRGPAGGRPDQLLPSSSPGQWPAGLAFAIITARPMAGQIGFYHHEGRPMAGRIGFHHHRGPAEARPDQLLPSSWPGRWPAGSASTIITARPVAGQMTLNHPPIHTFALVAGRTRHQL
jgi:hypothetical protein